MASLSSKRRKGKEPTVAEPPTYDTKKFKSQFHEARYHKLMKTKHVILEMGFELREGEYHIMRQITRERRWELLCHPLTEISAVMIREFYANAVKDSKDSPPYTRALKLRTITYGELSFEDRLQRENDPY
ncbi:uncharacterized protein DS421_19g655190 [Arachis hypogaea]|uniref:Uncharacterized protein n=1 Tax=Arachis hypogaea TaxID=3818 RepID=A0A6B9V8Q0_ARAHY|nr:uncharacterized protein DS421_19g655190 [Arachis hypogaea]